jgi:gas vesicle protein
MSFWRGMITGSILGIIAATIFLPEAEPSRRVRVRDRVNRIDRAQRMVRGVAKLADLMK